MFININARLSIQDCLKQLVLYMYTKLLKIADEELKSWHNLVSNCWTPLYAGPVTHARTEGLIGQVSKVPHLGVDLQSEEEPESGMRGEGVKLLF